MLQLNQTGYNRTKTRYNRTKTGYNRTKTGYNRTKTGYDTRKTEPGDEIYSLDLLEADRIANLMKETNKLC